MSLLAPNVNTYRRITRYNIGADQRAVGLRQPHRGPARAAFSEPQERRIENRLGGADANPYLAIAASLACGYLGMIEGPQADRADHRLGLRAAILAADDARGRALRCCAACKPLVEVFGERFVAAYGAVKENEYETFSRVISSWEREHLLLNV